MARADQRAHMKSIMQWMIGEGVLLHYLQKRPMTLPHLTEQQVADLLAHGHSLTADCSEFVTAVCKWGGLADPSGRGYDGQGNTQTMLDHLPRYENAAAAEVAAIAMFGAGHPLAHQHVAFVMESGKDPLLCSQGGDPGPLKVRLSIERQYHPGTPVFLSIAHL